MAACDTREEEAPVLAMPDLPDLPELFAALGTEGLGGQQTWAKLDEET